MIKNEVNIVWLRRDLRLNDNTALINANSSNLPVLLLFIFDNDILSSVKCKDSRLTFIYDTLRNLNHELNSYCASLLVRKGSVTAVFEKLFQEFSINSIYANEDYEPYGLARDQKVLKLCDRFKKRFLLFKDHVIFSKSEVLKKDGSPYIVFTPYKKQWLNKFDSTHIEAKSDIKYNFAKHHQTFPSLRSIGFERGQHQVKSYSLNNLSEYESQRDYPSKDIGSYIGPHLRFGTVSVRHIVSEAIKKSDVFLSELIWREFFMQILFHFPDSAENNFKPNYKLLVWRNNESELKRWMRGTTGFPLVDAGIRQLNKTGYMHNRVRMVAASFLCKHLLIDWRWGEAYFASKLLDFELSSNVGNWQWAASTGCDAVPYFRIFNPETQQKRFDAKFEYIKKWIPEYGTENYPPPMVDNKMARNRAISTFKLAQQ